MAGLQHYIEVHHPYALRNFTLQVGAVWQCCWRYVLEDIKQHEADGLLFETGDLACRIHPRLSAGIFDYPEAQLSCGAVTTWSNKHPCRMCNVEGGLNSESGEFRKGAQGWEVRTTATAKAVLQQVEQERFKKDKMRLLKEHGLSGLRSTFVYDYDFPNAGGFFARTAQDPLHHIKVGLAARTVEFVVQALEVEGNSLDPPQTTAMLERMTARINAIPAFGDASTGLSYRRFLGNILKGIHLALLMKMQLENTRDNLCAVVFTTCERCKHCRCNAYLFMSLARNKHVEYTALIAASLCSAG